MNDAPRALSPRIAGFWRRVAALLVDSLALGVFGAGLGWIWFAPFAALGSWGRLIGAAIAVLYFGFSNSRFTGGRTLGKRALRIRVVDARSRPIGLVRSGLRALVLVFPVTLNGMSLPGVSSPLGMTAASACVLGLGGATVYLFVFDRRTRRSLHDLTAGTFVVGADSAGEIHAQIWRPHLAIVAAWLLLTAAAPAPLAAWLGRTETVQGLLELQRAIEAEVPGAEIGVFRGKKFATNLGGERSSTSYLRVKLAVPSEPASYEGLAGRVAAAALRVDPSSSKVEELGITISYGYDILIAHGHVTRSFSHAPREWEERLGSASEGGGSGADER